MGNHLVSFIKWLKASRLEYANVDTFTIEVNTGAATVYLPTGGYVMFADYTGASYKSGGQIKIIALKDCPANDEYAALFGNICF